PSSVLLDSTNGVVCEFSGLFNFIKCSLFTLKFKSIFSLFSLAYDYMKYKKKMFTLQEEQNYSFDSVEKLLRKIDPKMFTLTQHSVKSWLDANESLKSLVTANTFKLATLATLGYSNYISGLTGIASLINLCTGHRLEEEADRKI